MVSIVISEPIVSVEWLHSNLDAENLIVLDASIKKVGGGDNDSKSELQIPKSLFFDLKETFSDVSGPFPTTFPSEDQFTKGAQSLGINADSAIVYYKWLVNKHPNSQQGELAQKRLESLDVE